jgi:hypothetical protein
MLGSISVRRIGVGWSDYSNQKYKKLVGDKGFVPFRDEVKVSASLVHNTEPSFELKKQF